MKKLISLMLVCAMFSLGLAGCRVKVENAGAAEQSHNEEETGPQEPADVKEDKEDKKED